MCGIIGYVGSQQATPILLTGLTRLEYRGYDSAGIGVMRRDGGIGICKKTGKLENLVHFMQHSPFYGTLGIGHTRWATHGAGNERNAHPHHCGRVAIVHNGIIENYAELRDELAQQGCMLSSETDTEVIGHLINRGMTAGLKPLAATSAALDQLRGSFALAILFEDHDNLLIAACQDSPLIIGVTEHGHFIASDEMALTSFTDTAVRLRDGDVATIDRKGFLVYDGSGYAVTREAIVMDTCETSNQDTYTTFTEKEIYEQPNALKRSIAVPLPELPFEIGGLKRLWLIGCGTSFHAGLAMKPLFEELWRVPVTCVLASEFPGEPILFAGKEAGILLSQSGETADIIAALHWLHSHACPTFAIVNRRGSQLARLARAVAYLPVGPEVGVASTKAFTAQIAVLARIALSNPEFYRGGIEWTDNLLLRDRFKAIRNLPEAILQVLALAPHLATIARSLAAESHLLYIGRGINHAVCMEGALKMKELAYVHAEALAAGELKHGSLALVDECMSVVAIAPKDRWFTATTSNIHEVVTRGGKVLVLSNRAGCDSLAATVWQSVALPDIDSFLAPALYAVALQLLAFHVAVCRGNDVDKPRNLAKAVTTK